MSSAQGGKKMWCLLFTLAKTAWCLLSYIQSVWVQERQRGTIDLIYTARQLQEECQEQNVDLYMTSVILNKGFNIVSCDGLWKIMKKFVCHLRFIAMVQKFHNGMQAHIQKDGEYSALFLVTKGVKQDCAMALKLFSMMFSAVLKDAFQTVMLHGFTI